MNIDSTEEVLHNVPFFHDTSQVMTMSSLSLISLFLLDLSSNNGVGCVE